MIKQLIRTVAVACATAAVSLCPAQQTAKPNIIFIFADDLGYGDVGCFGQQKIHTPHIDKLAAEGTKYTQFYAGSAVCAPSRATLLTGLHTGHSAIRGNGNPPLPAEPESLGPLMKKAGYHTGVIGKWGMGKAGTSGAVGSQGFDEFVGFVGQVAAHEQYPEFLYRNDEKMPLPKGTYANDVFTSESVEFVRRNKENPFFLYLPITAPHQKMMVPSLGEYADKDWPESEKIKAAMITRMDAGVGLLMDELKKQGLADNTLVFFTSDNGPHKEGVDPEFFDSNGPFRGIKRDLYEGGIREPMIAWWPGKIAAGATNDQIWVLYDVLPTLLDIVGAPIPEGRDGISLKTALLEGKPVEHPPLYWEFYEHGFSQAVRKGDWKLVKTTTGALELYNIPKDPGETTSLSYEHADIVMELMPLLSSMRTNNDHWKLSEVADKASEKAKKKANPGKNKKNRNPDGVF